MGPEGNAEKPSVSRRIAYRLATGVSVFDEDPIDGGLSISQWMALWHLTNQPIGYGFVRIEWPDGGALLDQPALGVEMLELVGEQIVKAALEAQARSG